MAARSLVTASGRVAHRWRRRPLLGLAALSAVPLVTLLLVGPALGAAVGTFLAVSDEPVPADATVLTYSVNSFARPQARRAALEIAAERYRRGAGPRVLLSTFRAQDDSFSTRTGYATRFLVRAGVPGTAVTVLPAVGSEQEEALALRDAAAGQAWHRVVVYVPDFRARRTAGAAKRAMAPTGVDVRVVALPDPDLPLERWWQTRDGIATVGNEYPRLLYYFLLGRL